MPHSCRFIFWAGTAFTVLSRVAILSTHFQSQYSAHKLTFLCSVLDIPCICGIWTKNSANTCRVSSLYCPNYRHLGECFGSTLVGFRLSIAHRLSTVGSPHWRSSRALSTAVILWVFPLSGYFGKLAPNPPSQSPYLY